jgi:hypothetical protein
MADASASNWLGLLRWSMTVNDGTAPSEFSAMSAEDKAWLETVMKEVVRSDPQRMDEVVMKVKELLEQVLAAKAEGASLSMSEDEEDFLLNELEDLRDIVEQIDMAQVFCKFGGCDILLRLAEQDNCVTSVRILCVAIIGTVAQNNLVVQDALFSQGLLQRLCRLLVDVSALPKLHALCKKVLFAVSASVRGHAAAEEHFALQELQPIATVLLPHPVLRAKLFFIASALVESDYCSEVRTVAVTRALLLSLLALQVPTSDTIEDTSAEEIENTEFGLMLLKDLLQTRVGQTLLLSSPNTITEVEPVDDAPTSEELTSEIEDVSTASASSLPATTANVATSLTQLRSLAVSKLFTNVMRQFLENVQHPNDRLSVVHRHIHSIAQLIYENEDPHQLRRKNNIAILYPRLEHRPSAAASRSTTHHPDNEHQQPPVMLIAPPPLAAASRAP